MFLHLAVLRAARTASVPELPELPGHGSQGALCRTGRTNGSGGGDTSPPSSAARLASRGASIWNPDVLLVVCFWRALFASGLVCGVPGTAGASDLVRPKCEVWQQQHGIWNPDVFLYGVFGMLV